MRARVIVTKKCNRKCKGCCNERLGLIDKVSFEDLFKYEEICITGGEPMLMSERVVEMIHRLRLILFMTWDTGIDQEMRLILLLSPECYQVRSIKGCTSLTRDIMILIQKRLY